MVTVVALRSEKVRRYVEDRALPVDILVDDGREVLGAYGVWQRVGDATIVRPALFVIDREGVVRYAFVAERQHEFPAFDDILRELEAARQE